MKTIALLLVFSILVTTSVLAEGLEITEIDVSVDYDEAYTYRIERRDRIDSTTVPVANNTKIGVDVLPGSNVTFTVRVENTFQGEDPDLRGVFATITIEDIDDGADLDEESIDFDLEPGNDNRVDVKFPIPLDVDAGTYNVIMEAEGEDRNKTSYKTEVRLKLEVKKQSHDIRITKVLLNPSIVDCDRKAKLTAEIVNAGSNAENQVALEFKATSLGVNSYDKDISLESSDEASEEEKTHTKTLNIEVPSFFKAGTFPILINLYWKNFVLFDQKTVDLVVRDCVSGKPKAEPEQEVNEEKPVVVIQPEDGTKEQTAEEPVTTSTQEITILSSPMLAMLLGGFVVIVLAVLIVIGYRTKPQ
ncbi:hypothetical protein J4448_07255 [Candidatus Woesearchaeota archaeon]|nr:hypothetical protein [Candidatus Woesearchaeota archaeon]